MDHQHEGLYWTLWWIISLKWIKNLIRTLWVVCNNLYVIPAHCVWMQLLWPLSFVCENSYQRIGEYFFDKILRLVAFWNYTAGYRVVESGDNLDDIFHQHKFLFMPNHQSTADVPLCMTLFCGQNRVTNKVMWIMDKVFKYTNFGLVSWLHDDFFILAGKDNRDRTLVELKTHLKDVFIPKKRRCLVMFPEGGFLRKRKPISHKFALKNNLPLLEYCTLPRTGALEIILECLGPKAYQATKLSDHNSNGTNSNSVTKSEVKSDSASESSTNGSILRLQSEQLSKIVDVTIAYDKDSPLNLLNIITAVRPPCITHVHYRVFDIKDVPTEPDEIRQWMYQLYFEKEKMLQKFNETGEFPYKMFDDKASPPRELIQEPMQAVIFNLFYLLSTAAFIYLGMTLFSILTK